MAQLPRPFLLSCLFFTCPTALMGAITQRFYQLDTLIDDAHAFLAPFTQTDLPLPQAALWDRLALVLHEWLANLVRHSQFHHAPTILIRITPQSEQLQCIVEDNSMGFDMATKLEEAKNDLQPLPERGMGLLWLTACAPDARYEPMPPNGHRLTFTISNDDTEEPWVNILS